MLSTMLAYIGPGGALTAIGSFLSLLAAVVLALFGFVWYPIKRLLRSLRSRKALAAPGDNTSEVPVGADVPR
ncbi:MAG TPA: hypothetical protein VFZ65_00970 [Planctomycetota bacterium]|nr:hypothetical protein [Planctomycetota bacterium]